jgi:hypothetical protein
MRAAILLLSLFVAACGPAPEPQLTVRSVTASPDRLVEAVVVTQDPGALGGKSTAVIVRRLGSHDLRDRVFVCVPEGEVSTWWNGPDTLVVSYPANADVRHLQSLDGIRVVASKREPKADLLADPGRPIETHAK